MVESIPLIPMHIHIKCENTIKEFLSCHENKDMSENAAEL